MTSNIETIIEECPSAKLGFNAIQGPCCYPAKSFFIELPSGMRHWFESEKRARVSGYWPRH